LADAFQPVGQREREAEQRHGDQQRTQRALTRSAVTQGHAM
jgi:hypothetical protein